ncbi:MAG: right-handed parallel beta-helix repeat-containing protein [Candidatus Methanospirareceae archaeon]
MGEEVVIMDKKIKPISSLRGTPIIRPKVIGVAAALAILIMLILALSGASSAQEIRFTGTVTGKNPPGQMGALWWNVTAVELISGPQTSCDTLKVEVIIYPPMGHIESGITIGDRVEVCGNYTSDCTVSLNNESYYIVVLSVHNLNTTKDFATIRAAINDADTVHGHTIIVDSGTYYENVIVNKSLTLRGENRDNTTIDGNGSGNVIQLVADNCTIQNFTIQNAGQIAGIYMGSHYNRINHNKIKSNSREGIYCYANNNIISDNIIELNGDYGIWLHGSSNNTISNNFISSNNADGFILVYSSNFNLVSGNYISMNGDGIRLGESNNNTLRNNILLNNRDNGICMQQESNDNAVYHNNFLNNTNHALDDGNNNSWDNGYPNGGNYWSGYNCTDSYMGPNQDITGHDGIGDTPYSISGAAGAQDRYPLMHPTAFFNTGQGAYPSISGTHNGTIRPFYDLNVSKMYTYSCPGTGGHTEYVKIWNSTGWNVTATWNGYRDDWHYLSFNSSFTLHAHETYNYTIRTGSYPQLIHKHSWNAIGGVITCSEFIDRNGKRYEGGIPAINLS